MAAKRKKTAAPAPSNSTTAAKGKRKKSEPKSKSKSEPEPESGYVIGIDLGTTFSCVAVSINDRIEIIANDQGNRTTPSVISFDSDNQPLIGESARNQAASNPRGTVFDSKRLIGKKFDDEELQNDLKYLPYSVVNKDEKPYVDLQSEGVNFNNKKTLFSPEEISAMVLEKMKETAESYLGEPVSGAVVTVPAYFNDAQRQATKEAGTIAGLNVLRVVNEPTAGALAYGLDRKKRMPKKGRKILVYDLGGGTFDVSVVVIKGGGVFEVVATGGDTHLGGGDFDRRVTEYFVDLIKKKYGKDVSGDSRALGKLRRECERAKRILSSQSQVRVEIEYFLDGGKDFSEVLTRVKFEELNMDLFKKTMEIVKRTMEEGKVEKKEIEEIVLVGGSTRITKVREMLKEMFNGKEPCQTVNPDEAVAYGAAVLGAKLSDQTSTFRDVTLLDVTPLSLGMGIGLSNDIMSVVIPKNTRIPVKRSQTLTTVEHRQTQLHVKVFQGERPLTKDCVELGNFFLNGIPPAPRGVGMAEVTFEVDENGILTVTAKDTTAGENMGNSESMTVTNYKGNLSKEEVEKTVKEAKKMAAKDKKEKERVEARNHFEEYMSDLRAELKDRYGDRKAEIVNALEEASRWLKDNVNDASRKDYEEKEAKLTVEWSDVRQNLRVIIQVDDD